MTSSRRWIRFNLVGVAGFVVQMLTLAVATRAVGLPAAVAVPIAVLAAVTHNFFWHEHVTWPDRQRAGRSQRWLSFNLSNGFISMVSNLAITTAIVTTTGASVLIANAIAVVVASAINFVVSDRYVFRHVPATGPGPGGCNAM